MLISELVLAGRYCLDRSRLLTVASYLYRHETAASVLTKNKKYEIRCGDVMTPGCTKVTEEAQHNNDIPPDCEFC